MASECYRLGPISIQPPETRQKKGIPAHEECSRQGFRGRSLGSEGNVMFTFTMHCLSNFHLIRRC